MKKFWSFVSMVLGGIIIGLIAADKLSMGAESVFKGNFRFKQKGKGNVQDATVKPEIVQKSRKAERIVAKLERQKEKAEKKINKQHERKGPEGSQR